MKKEENGRQLKLNERDQDEVVVKKKGKSKRNKVRDRWVVFVVLFITVVVSLGFYLVSFGGGSIKKEKAEEKGEVEMVEQDDGFFGSAVHEF